jgi:hypothetical protein
VRRGAAVLSIVLLAPIALINIALAGGDERSACSRLVDVERVARFTKQEREELKRAAKSLRGSTESGHKKVADALSKANSDRKREAAVDDGLVWCEKHQLLPANQVGEQFSNGGITLTVTSAEAADAITVAPNQQNPTSMPAGPGAKYVVIRTHIINNARKSLDLTCSLPIHTLLLDDRGREFDPIEDLDEVQGNPECNAQLQPGFESDMTWPYRVPADTHVVAWAFEDVKELAETEDQGFTRVRIQVPGA